MSRAENAKAYFLQGYNCAQAVALSFADICKTDKETLLKMTLPFGGGVGRLRLTCGAFSGIATVVGLVFAQSENTPENKKQIYAIVQTLGEKFRSENGSYICAELLAGANVTPVVGGEADARTEQYYKKRPCAEIVYGAAAILENYLLENGVL